MVARLITRTEIETFKREGAVVLRDFIPMPQIDQWNGACVGHLIGRFATAAGAARADLLATCAAAEYWAFMGADPDDPLSWPGKPRFDLSEHFGTRHASNLGGELTGAGFRPGTLDPTIPRLTALPSVRALADQLGGEGNVAAPFPFDGHLIPHFPRAGAAWEPPARAHWDGYGPKRLDWRLQRRLRHRRLPLRRP
eukprot:SAG11_NODE_1856_length_4162_cov_4.778981_7_plen_196_part_00